MGGEDLKDEDDVFALYFPYLPTKLVNKERAIKQLEFELDRFKNGSGADIAGKGFGIYCVQSFDKNDRQPWYGRYSSKEFLGTLHEDINDGSTTTPEGKWRVILGSNKLDEIIGTREFETYDEAEAFIKEISPKHSGTNTPVDYATIRNPKGETISGTHFLKAGQVPTKTDEPVQAIKSKATQGQKRYPLWLYQKLEDAVAKIDDIPDNHKDEFITLVGDRATTKKIPGIGYKSSLLPKACVFAKENGLPCKDYNSLIAHPEYYGTTIEDALRTIYNTMKKRWFSESLEMAVGGDDFDGEIKAMRDEQKELEDRRAARKTRMALYHNLFDKYEEEDPNARWINKVFDLFFEATEVKLLNKVSEVPNEVDGQKVKYYFSVKDYNFYVDAYKDYIYIVPDSGLITEGMENKFEIHQGDYVVVDANVYNDGAEALTWGRVVSKALSPNGSFKAYALDKNLVNFNIAQVRAVYKNAEEAKKHVEDNIW